MKTRREIKALARSAIGAQRGTSILIILLVTLISGAVGGIGTFVGLIPVIGWLISIALSFLIMVLSVNVCGSFVRIYNGVATTVGDPFSKLTVNFFRKLGGMYWMSLWIFLWSLLLIIPGIIKTYAYSMAPYILADCPNVTATDALKLSRRMTSGNKGKLFVLDLSFIGWGLLSVLTFGILFIVYVGPYLNAATAGFYTELREQAIASGTIAPEEFGNVENAATAEDVEMI
jgi:uncharacterized membrane protein